MRQVNHYKEGAFLTSLYAGIDLHSNNSYLAVLDQDDKRVFLKKLPNMADVLLAELEPFNSREGIKYHADGVYVLMPQVDLKKRWKSTGRII